ncbi:cysteine desulfurase family protein [Lapidilactobacillus gannanensis]|jgi:cysteine desulfurase|uniref:cysteine desulfurase n=1 Tax=Lapidilactobacillus gannanensis TaxID=2486002 RepID=A0ABW4BP36_9LACO|nr:cysteine desulfurase family protein [Lapidilactobacillus gannanensis]MCH4058214.1 cysteine desulfurase [Lactobacillaceae bacterium]
MTHYYFDNAATTPMSSSVVAAMTEVLQHSFGNASSTHYFGRQAHHLLDQSRQTLATSIHAASPEEIIFTSGGTESDNTAILSTVRAYSDRGHHIITTAIEHPAVLQTMAYLEQHGYEVTYLPVDQQGQISLADLQAALRPDTILVSVMLANNEVGSIEPIAEIGRLLADHQAIFHTDAVQAYGVLNIDVQELGVDFLSISGHKLHGPKGIGFLYARTGVKLVPFMRGGEQEHKRRAGTENIPGIVGLAQAAHDLAGQEKAKKRRQLFAMKQEVINVLTAEQVDFAINGPDLADAAPHVLNIWLKGVPTELALMNLDLRGFAVSGGSACTAGSLEPSHVLIALFGEQAPQIRESLRLSFGSENDLASAHQLGLAISAVAHDYLQKKSAD